METIEARPDRLGRDQMSLTEAVRPSPGELVVARRRLHLKAVVIGALAVSSYWYLIATDSSVIGKIMATVVLVIALTSAATCVFHDANHLPRIQAIVVDCDSLTDWILIGPVAIGQFLS